MGPENSPNWQLQGDRNTTFYHVKIINKRKANRIDRLKNRVGIGWILNNKY